MKDLFFIRFESVEDFSIPEQFALFQGGTPHPLCLLAAEQLQNYLSTQNEWRHNFGLAETQDGTIIGKMFGVLIVKTPENEIGYLAAFSGKLAGSNLHSKFVPPVFDSLRDDGFLNKGMTELFSINEEIKKLGELNSVENEERIASLKTARKKHSNALQNQLYDHYYFLNKAGEEKSLTEIFKKALYKNPPSGAGECAGPKLLQYAFQNQMQPLALVEFWWGQSPKSDHWKHKQFYPCCKEKCEPILRHMLDQD